MRRIARGTFTPNVISDIGSFGGLFRASFEGIEKPILVSSTDGVGTKLRVAQAMKIHDTVGYDLVCHCVNDILVQGARPLFFLDYYATGKLRPPVMTDVIRGMARACSENGCALIGGETAEMPGFYGDDDYDIAGFIVGVVDEKNVIDGKAVREGDVLIGLPSAGLHTNGYSLARADPVRPARPRLSDDPARASARSARRCSRRTSRISSRCMPLVEQRAHSRAGAHHRRRPHRQRSARAARHARRAHQARLVAGAAGLPLPLRAGRRRSRRDAARLQHGHRHGAHRRHRSGRRDRRTLHADRPEVLLHRQRREGISGRVVYDTPPAGFASWIE